MELRIKFEELRSRLIYIVYCNETGKDIRLKKSHDAFKEFLKATKVHEGSCVKIAGPCCRCMLQSYEIEAENILHVLSGSTNFQKNYFQVESDDNNGMA